jgi:hypothetical protein
MQEPALSSIGYSLDERQYTLLEPLRFIWNATRGYRLTPWRSPYLRWRIETFSGKKAETLKATSIFAFVWASRWELLSFLMWTGHVEREARRRS